MRRAQANNKFGLKFLDLWEALVESRFKPARREPAPPGDTICGLVAFREGPRVFQITTRIGEATYDIEADRLLTHKQFTDWVWQLQEKG